MLLDSNQLDQSAPELAADVCVVGAGAAGITIARELGEKGVSVLLMEGGGDRFEMKSQDLYRGKTSGYLESRPHYPFSSRLRFFGGTTNHWAGWCRPMDPVDFETRDWVPESGWPIKYDEFWPYYARASSIVDIGKFAKKPSDEFSNAEWWRPILDLNQEVETIESKMFFFSPPTRFGLKYRAELEKSQNVRVYLNANCVDFAASPNRQAVSKVHFKNSNGNAFSVRAKQVVLACGAIENARILLNCRNFHPKGLANDHDNVGRYFTDHPEYEMGKALVWRNWYLTRLYTGQKPNSHYGNSIKAVLSTTKAFQHEKRTLNFSCDLVSDNLSMQHEGVEHELSTIARAHDEYYEDEIKRISTYPFDAVDFVRPVNYTKVNVRPEIAPNRESRVSLSSEKDALGLNRVSVNWKMGEGDFRSVATSVREIGRALSASYRGRVQLWPREKWAEIIVGNHHIGTTRMSKNPATGVVDANGRAHSVDNFFIAGSSTFPTSGSVNPTLTVVALATRLADHLKGLVHA